MKINLNKSFLDLNGKETGEVMGVTLAKNLVTHIASKDPIKIYEIALKLNKGNEFELDTSDTEMLKEFILNGQLKDNTGQLVDVFSVMGKAQLLLELKEK